MSATPAWPGARVRRIAGIVARTAILLALLEGGARAYFVVRHHYGWEQFVAPFKGSRVFHYKRRGDFTEECACAGGPVQYHVNAWGGRGPAWPLVKPAGSLRIVAEGGSSTFGSTNHESGTWPVLLQDALRRRGIPAEVLNMGMSGKRAEQIADDVEQIAKFQPDYVLFYESVNNATSHMDPHMHANVTMTRYHHYNIFGKLTRWLLYRSLLYTRLLEKSQMYLARQQEWTVPEIDYFREQLQRFVQQSRRHGIQPVFVLMVTRAPIEASLRELNLQDRTAVRDAILRAAAQRGAKVDDPFVEPRLSALWTYQTQVNVEVTRRLGEAQGVPVIDPRPRVLDGGPEPLFCDIIHLTDAGNRRLADAIAAAWQPAGLATAPGGQAARPHLASD